MSEAVEKDLPTRWQALSFHFKTACFRTRRILQELSAGRPSRQACSTVQDDLPVIAESRSLLYPSSNPAEFSLQAGKVQNLRVAASHLNGAVIPAAKTFSFWAQIPRPSRRGGFVDGRELREGCIVPSIGGGLCQLSNALYDAALKAGFEIVERHAHSRLVPGSMAEQGRDATIFWNYVDLRFRSKSDTPFQLEVLLGRGELVVRIRATERNLVSNSSPSVANIPVGDPVESCESCGITQCFRHPQTLGISQQQTTAWLVDAYWPEYDTYLQQHRGDSDYLFLPSKFSLGKFLSRYPWSQDGFAKTHHAPWQTIQRSLLSRRLRAQGAERQRALLKMDQQLALSFRRHIPHSATHLVVAQNLLPFLWRAGVLGGRSFDVLMTRLPMHELQTTLDSAAETWPESSTLSDFRADPSVVDDERIALEEARHWITPHSQIAALAGEKAIHLEWKSPPVEIRAPSPGGRLLYPASTLARKGCREIRELDRPTTLCGPVIEEPDFWSKSDVANEDFQTAIQATDIAVVVLPAWVENQPRRLLHAAAAGIPVIASQACGLEAVNGVTTVPTGDINALRDAYERLQHSQHSAV